MYFVEFVMAAGCDKAVWWEREDYMVTGANNPVEKITVGECLDHCAGDLSCVGMDVSEDEERKQCSPHTSPDDFISDNIINQTGTTSYELISTCSSNRLG